MKTAGALIRVSTAKQLQGTSPEKQLEKITAIASKQGFSIPNEYVWQLAESGNLREREGYVNALEAGDAKEISRVYVFNIDRLGRNLLEMLLFLRSLDDLGIECWRAERETRLRGDDFVLQIEGAVASKERQEIIKRTKDGLERTVRAGKYSGGIVAYGYKVNHATKKLDIQKPEAEVVKQIFDWTTNELISCVEIAERLNALKVATHYQKDGRGIRKTGKRKSENTAGIWRAGRIRNMLKNTAYMGTWVYGKRSKKKKAANLIVSNCPAIVNEAQFMRAAELLENNRIIKFANGESKYLLRGLIKCRNCGLTYCGTYSMAAPKKTTKRFYYACNGRTQWKKLGKEKCESASLNASEIETVVWEEIKSFCKHPDIAIQQLRERHLPQENEAEKRILDTENKLRELIRQEDNILKLSIESKEVDPSSIDNLLVENHREQQVLEEYRSSITANQNNQDLLEKGLRNVALRLRAVGKRIDNASFEQKRRAILELVKSISVESALVEDKLTPVVTITFAFNQPPALIPEGSLYSADIKNYTPASAVITAIR